MAIVKKTPKAHCRRFGQYPKIPRQRRYYYDSLQQDGDVEDMFGNEFATTPRETRREPKEIVEESKVQDSLPGILGAGNKGKDTRKIESGNVGDVPENSIHVVLKTPLVPYVDEAILVGQEHLLDARSSKTPHKRDEKGRQSDNQRLRVVLQGRDLIEALQKQLEFSSSEQRARFAEVLSSDDINRRTLSLVQLLDYMTVVHKVLSMTVENLDITTQVLTCPSMFDGKMDQEAKINAASSMLDQLSQAALSTFNMNSNSSEARCEDAAAEASSERQPPSSSYETELSLVGCLLKIIEDHEQKEMGKPESRAPGNHEEPVRLQEHISYSVGGNSAATSNQECINEREKYLKLLHEIRNELYESSEEPHDTKESEASVICEDTISFSSSHTEERDKKGSSRYTAQSKSGESTCKMDQSKKNEGPRKNTHLTIKAKLARTKIPPSNMKSFLLIKLINVITGKMLKETFGFGKLPQGSCKDLGTSFPGSKVFQSSKSKREHGLEDEGENSRGGELKTNSGSVKKQDEKSNGYGYTSSSSVNYHKSETVVKQCENETYENLLKELRQVLHFKQYGNTEMNETDTLSPTQDFLEPLRPNNACNVQEEQSFFSNNYSTNCQLRQMRFRGERNIAGRSSREESRVISASKTENHSSCQSATFKESKPLHVPSENATMSPLLQNARRDMRERDVSSISINRGPKQQRKASQSPLPRILAPVQQLYVPYSVAPMSTSSANGQNNVILVIPSRDDDESCQQSRESSLCNRCYEQLGHDTSGSTEQHVRFPFPSQLITDQQTPTMNSDNRSYLESSLFQPLTFSPYGSLPGFANESDGRPTPWLSNAFSMSRNPTDVHREEDIPGTSARQFLDRSTDLQCSLAAIRNAVHTQFPPASVSRHSGRILDPSHRRLGGFYPGRRLPTLRQQAFRALHSRGANPTGRMQQRSSQSRRGLLPPRMDELQASPTQEMQGTQIQDENQSPATPRRRRKTRTIFSP